MKKQILVGVGALLVLLGALWTGQGLGWIGNSGMSGQTAWAIIGPIVALVGAAMAVSGLRATRQSQ
jgi:hypothetical protein